MGAVHWLALLVRLVTFVLLAKGLQVGVLPVAHLLESGWVANVRLINVVVGLQLLLVALCTWLAPRVLARWLLDTSDESPATLGTTGIWSSQATLRLGFVLLALILLMDSATALGNLTGTWLRYVEVALQPTGSELVVEPTVSDVRELINAVLRAGIAVALLFLGPSLSRLIVSDSGGPE